MTFCPHVLGVPYDDDAHSFQHEIDSVSVATQNCHLNFNESKCSVLKVSRKRNTVQYPYRLKK